MLGFTQGQVNEHKSFVLIYKLINPRPPLRMPPHPMKEENNTKQDGNRYRNRDNSNERHYETSAECFRLVFDGVTQCRFVRPILRAA
jgi:hypothetical protein